MEVPQYMAELNAARNMDLLDWNSPVPNTYNRTFGKITIEVSLNPRTSAWEWKLVHERGGQLSNGSSEHKDVAQVEAIKYAETWVKNFMVGLLA